MDLIYKITLNRTIIDQKRVSHEINNGKFQFSNAEKLEVTLKHYFFHKRKKHEKKFSLGI
jgi:hypothetical protein